MKKIATFLLVISALNCDTQAEVDFMKLKGSNEFFQFQEKHQHLAPYMAFSLLRQGKLNNDFMYGDDASPITHLIRKSFHSISENPTFFQISPLAVNFVKFLGPDTLGQVVAELGKHDPKAPPSPETIKKIILNNPEFQERIKEADQYTHAAEVRLKEYQQMNPRLIEIANLEVEIKQKKLLLDTEKRSKKLEALIKESTRECLPDEKKSAIEQINQVLNNIFRPKREEIDLLEAKLKHLNETRDIDLNLKQLQSAILKVKYNERNLDSFIQTLLAAFKSESDPNNTYPPRYTEQVLMAIAWLNTENDKEKLKSLHAGSENEKMELLVLYRRLESMMTEESRSNLHDHSKLNRWLDTNYTPEDYPVLSAKLLQMTPSERAQHFLSHPEDLAFIAYGRPMFDPTALPTIGFKQIPFTHPDTKVKTVFPDCMDIAILNSMVNALAGGPGNSFDAEVLEINLKKLGHQIHPGLREFLKKYPDPSRINELDSHKDWAKLVSLVKGVTYLSPKEESEQYCEVDTTVTNALTLFEHLFFSHPIEGQNPVFKFSSLSRSEKLSRVNEVLSRADRIIEWQLKGSESIKALDNPSTDTNLVLEFKINGKPSFSWKINANHSHVDPKLSDRSDWRQNVGLEIVKALKGRFTSQNVRTLAWLLGSSDVSKIFENLKSERKSNFHWEILLSMPMETVDQKLLVIGELAEGGHKKEIEKLHLKIPSEDLASQQRYHSTLANHRFPFHEKENAVATGAEFVQVEEPRLGKGKFWKDSRGMIWGRTLMYGSGEDQRLNWEQAKKECLKLNRESYRKEVEDTLNQLESDKDIEKLRDAYKSDKNPLNRAELLKKYNQRKKDHPLRGCFLPPIEEQIMLGIDLGYHENKKENRYLPQFLTDLYGRDSKGIYRCFWSSSVSLRLRSKGFFANEGYGLAIEDGAIQTSYRFDNDNSVRCLCVGED